MQQLFPTKVLLIVDVGEMTELTISDQRLLLKAIIGGKSMKSLHVALARIIAAKPQSADVERLISTYNKIKTDGRSSISPETLCKYMFIAINMPDLASFNFCSPAKLWLEKKRRYFKHATEKAGKQEWFKGVFEGTGMQEESPEEDCSKTFKCVSLNKVKPRPIVNLTQKFENLYKGSVQGP